MPTFVVRAHSAPTDPAGFLGRAGKQAHVEYLAQIVQSALFISKGHRPEVELQLVLESSSDYSRTITLSGDSLGSLDGLTEAAILTLLADGLRASQGLGKERSVKTDSGIQVTAVSFERLARQYLADAPVFLLSRKGTDLREQVLDEAGVFLLTDHVPMPRNLEKSLLRQGAKPVSVGPVMLQASQCIVVVENEFDRRAGPAGRLPSFRE